MHLTQKQKHFHSLDGLRAIAALSIVAMHVLSNSNYKMSGFIAQRVIPSFSDFVFLFMTISAFGMCCGYYERIMHNQLSLSHFYERRFRKILPFFGILVLLDLILEPSLSHLYEAFADLTLLFGFLPEAGNITVIGVGWFLSVIFVFYLIFPFFCVLLENKRRAWGAFFISLVYNFICAEYFHVGKTNILYCSCFFLAGGLIYLYKDFLIKINKWFVLGVVFIFILLYYVSHRNIYFCLGLFASMVIYGIISHGILLENRITRFFSTISMEIYLSHMVIFRIVEKTGLNYLGGNGWPQYLFTTLTVIILTSVFSFVARQILSRLTERQA